MSRASRAKAGVDTAERIVDAALELAEEHGWDNVRLHQLADRTGLPLRTIGERFADLDAIANAWFRRARDVVLSTPPAALTGAAPERLELVMIRWFKTVTPQRRVTDQMLRTKLYPSHPHHWVPLIFDLSRLMHSFLDAARIHSTGRQRQLAETGLTLIFLATLRTWLNDDSNDQERTRAGLRRRLDRADRWLPWLDQRSRAR